MAKRTFTIQYIAVATCRTSLNMSYGRLLQSLRYGGSYPVIKETSNTRTYTGVPSLDSNLLNWAINYQILHSFIMVSPGSYTWSPIIYYCY